MDEEKQTYPRDVWGLQKEAYRIADEKGFHSGRNVPTRLALIHSEVSEALEVDRSIGNGPYGEELADIVIRVLDTAEIDGVNLEAEIHRKMAKNEGRDYKHGKRY